MDSDDLKAVGFWILNGLMLWGFSKVCIEWNFPYWFLFAVAFVIITWLLIWLLWELGTVGGYFSIFTLIKCLLAISFFTALFAICGAGFYSLLIIPLSIWLIFGARDADQRDNY